MMINLQAIRATDVAVEPFPHMVVPRVLDSEALAEVSHDFPAIKNSGVFPLSELTYGKAFQSLLDAIQGDDFEAAMEEKFQVKLADKPMMITVRGQCAKRDGRIHTDSKDKIVTCLLYLNDPSWEASGGRLRLLRDGENLDNMVAEVPPNGGSFVAFKRTDNCWHGHAPYEGQRRYIMFNWVRSDAVLAKNIWRHKISSAFKKIGLYRGGY